MKVFLTSICWLVVLIAPVSAEFIFVDSSFEGVSNGTIDAPFVLIQDALDVVSPNDTVLIRGGTGDWPLGYMEEGLVVDTEGVTITNWPDDLWDPWIVGSLDLDPEISAPRPLLDGVEILASDVLVSNLIVIDAWYAGISVRWRGSEILDTSEMIENVQIKDCYTFRTGSSGILVQNTTNVVVEGNTITRAVQRYYQECLTLTNVHGFVVARNEVKDRPTFPGANGGEGIDAKNGCRDGVIKANRVIDVARFGIYVDGFAVGCNNIEICNNFVRNCGSGLSIASEVGGKVEGVFAHGNIVMECPAGLFFGPHQTDFEGPHPISNVRIEFNTFIRNRGWGINIANSDISGLRINNNIIIDNETGSIRVRDDVDPVAIGLRVKNNLFKANETDFDDGNVTVVNDTFQLFVQAYDMTNPNWNDPIYFAPRARSKARNAGWNTAIGEVEVQDGVVIRRDIAGRKRRTSNFDPVGGRQDIGAREGTFNRITF